MDSELLILTEMEGSNKNGQPPPILTFRSKRDLSSALPAGEMKA